MPDLLSVNTVFFTVLGYPMSYLEFFGTLFNLACVILVIRKNIWTWPVGIVGVVLFGILFYQIQLYSDLVEQVYYFITGFYGWVLWSRIKNKNILGIKRSTSTETLWTIGIIVVGTAVLGYLMSNIHVWFADIFPEPASFPYVDAGTTVMSFAAQFLMAHKRLENWWLWIAVDVVAIVLYAVKGVMFVSLLYAIFLVLATNGYFVWRKELGHAGKHTKRIVPGKLRASS